MDEGVLEKPSRVRVLETWDRKPVVIDGTVTKTQGEGTAFLVRVGNTGLSMDFREIQDKYSIRGDFLPGGYAGLNNQDPIPDNDAIRMFLFGIYSFNNWVKTSGEIDITKINKFFTITNNKFRGFLESFFKKSGHSDLITFYKGDRDQSYMDLELGKLLALPDDDPLAKKINKAGKRIEGRTVPALVRVS